MFPGVTSLFEILEYVCFAVYCLLCQKQNYEYELLCQMQTTQTKFGLKYFKQKLKSTVKTG